MKLTGYIPFFFFLLWGSISPCLSQDQTLSMARHAFRHLDYSKALDLYNSVPELHQDEQALEERAICYFHTNHLKQAIEDLTLSKKQGNKDPELYWYMAQCNHHLEKYEEAVFFYKEYIFHSNDRAAHFMKAHKELKNCLFVLEKKDAHDNEALVQIFNDSINSSQDEIAPVQSPSFGNVFYYSTTEDQKGLKIRTCSIDSSGNWIIQKNENPLFEAFPYSEIQDVSDNGQSLLFKSKNTRTDKNEYFFTTLDSLGKEYLIPLDNVLFEQAEDIQIVNKNTLAFASKAFDSYGGYDIFTVEYKNGSWSVPLNAGNTINSPSNERSPAYSYDLKKLYFSSDRAYSFGGYDLYTLDDEYNPINLGPSVNSPGDELHLSFDLDNHMGVFSSNRKSGVGGFDLYFLYLQDVHKMGLNDTELSYVSESLKEIKTQELLLPELDDNENEIDSSKSISVEMDRFYSEVTAKPANIYNIFYEDSHDLRNRVNTIKLIEIADLIKKDTLHLLLQAHTDGSDPGLEEYVQYACFKRAIKLAEHLVSLGISPGSITIESLVDNYPLIRTGPETVGFDSLYYLNKRIDAFLFKKSELQNKDVGSVWKDLDSYVLHPSYQLFSLIQEGLYFSIRIASTNRMYKNSALRLYNDVFIRRDSFDGPNEYYIGLYTKLEDALKLQEQLGNTHLSSVDIVAFYGRHKLTEKEIEELAKSRAELKGLLK